MFALDVHLEIEMRAVTDPGAADLPKFFTGRNRALALGESAGQRPEMGVQGVNPAWRTTMNNPPAPRRRTAMTCPSATACTSAPAGAGRSMPG